jgi:hypothetical protein
MAASLLSSLGEVTFHGLYEEPQVGGLVVEVSQQHVSFLFGDESPPV